jgi:hypothetical protein
MKKLNIKSAAVPLDQDQLSAEFVDDEDDAEPEIITANKSGKTKGKEVERENDEEKEKVCVPLLLGVLSLACVFLRTGDYF